MDWAGGGEGKEEEELVEKEEEMKLEGGTLSNR